MTLLAHPFADLFPMLDRTDAADLRADIAAHGLRDRVVLFDGKILDGRNRYGALVDIAKLGLLYKGKPFTEVDLVDDLRAAESLGTGYYFGMFKGTEAEALEYVLSKNLHRRHLNEGQRAMVAANLAGLKPGRPSPDKPANLPVFKQADAAERLHVSERSVRDAHVVREHGIDDINDAVQRGDLAVSAAAQLARLPADEQARLIRETADPKALAKVARDLRAEKQAAKAERREERERALGAKLAALPDRRYGVILADPEWKYEVWSDATGRDRSPDNHYPTSELDAIKARPVADIAADDSILFLWVTPPFLDAGRDVLTAWGFDYVTNLVWFKERRGDAHGIGYWFYGEHEHVLVGKRGSPPAPTPGTQFPSYFVAPVGEHSEKPAKVHEIAESYFPNLPKIELNARARRAGWDAWGLEAPEGDDEDSRVANAPAMAGAHCTDSGPATDTLGALAIASADAVALASGPSDTGVLASPENLRVLHRLADEPPRKAGLAVDSRAVPSARPVTLPLPDAAAIDLIGEAVAAAIGDGAILRAGDSRLHTPAERLIRRHVIRIAFDSFGLSFPRLAAVLGGSKQAAAQLRATAFAEVAADPALADRLCGVPGAVAGRAWQ